MGNAQFFETDNKGTCISRFQADDNGLIHMSDTRRSLPKHRLPLHSPTDSLGLDRPRLDIYSLVARCITRPRQYMRGLSFISSLGTHAIRIVMSNETKPLM